MNLQMILFETIQKELRDNEYILYDLDEMDWLASRLTDVLLPIYMNISDVKADVPAILDEIESMIGVLQELVDYGGSYPYTNGGEFVCTVCSYCDKENGDHTNDCPIARARKLLEKYYEGENKYE